MDMGCHAIEFFRWLLGRTGDQVRVRPDGHHVHGDKTHGDDEAILILDFDERRVGLAEESWTKLGGMDDRAEVLGRRASPMPICCTATPSKPTCRRLRLRRRKGRFDCRLVLHDLRGDLELRLRAGDGALR